MGRAFKGKEIMQGDLNAQTSKIGSVPCASTMAGRSVRMGCVCRSDGN